jgi:initiation factor 1A
MPPKKKGKNNKNKSTLTEPKQLLRKEDDQEYARVCKVLGSGHFRLKLNITGKEVIGKLRGLMRRRKGTNFVDLDSVVLVSIRDFETVKDKVESVDILHVYSDNEVRILKKNNDFIEDIVENKLHKEDRKEEIDNEDTGFDFEDI